MMTRCGFALCVSFLLGACTSDPAADDVPTEDDGTTSTSGGGGADATSTSSVGGNTTSTGGSQGVGGSASGPEPRDDVSAYFYGHSLVSFDGGEVGTMMCGVAGGQDLACCADGQWPGGLAPSAFDFYGYPPDPSQGHQPSCWQGWNGSFAASGADVLVITEANFIQYEGPETSIASGTSLIDTVRDNDPQLPIYLYEHWPEFAGDITFASWKASAHAPFHAWFESLQDGLNANIDGPPVKLVPVGTLFTQALVSVPALDALTEADLFVDSAPHGTATSYFLSGLVHYMALYQRMPATDAAAVAAIPNEVHASVADNYADIVNVMWTALGEVVDDGGNSRVF